MYGYILSLLGLEFCVPVLVASRKVHVHEVTYRNTTNLKKQHTEVVLLVMFFSIDQRKVSETTVAVP